jgi:predicted lipid-binding transport protein (Tim44 family)
MNSSMDFSTLVFILMAAFVGWRLYSVLGMRTGHDEDSPPPIRPSHPQEERGQVLSFPAASGEASPAAQTGADRWKGIAEPHSALARDLDAICAADSDFDVEDFLNGAKSAYEMIVTAFAQGDRVRLKDLLSPVVFEGFNAAITEREKRGEVMSTTFVAIDSAVLVDAHLKDQMIQITVKFSSKLITVTKDSSGKVIEGAADKIVDVTDIWTFERKAMSASPAWHLVATESAQAA